MKGLIEEYKRECICLYHGWQDCRLNDDDPDSEDGFYNFICNHCRLPTAHNLQCQGDRACLVFVPCPERCKANCTALLCDECNVCGNCQFVKVNKGRFVLP
jgi:hypothetical protein